LGKKEMGRLRILYIQRSDERKVNHRRGVSALKAYSASLRKLKTATHTLCGKLGKKQGALSEGG